MSNCEIEKAVIALNGRLPKRTDPRKDGGYYVAGMGLYRIRGLAAAKYVCDQNEFLAKRSELENMPDEWEGEFLCQNGAGLWRSFDSSQEPKISDLTPNWVTARGPVRNYGYGHVFGNWQDSLQRRPVELQYEPEDVAFKKEWVPGVDLPPIGQGVTVSTDEYTVSAHVIAHTKNPTTGAPVAVFWTDGDRHRIGGAIARHFSKPKSHRDQCIESALSLSRDVPPHDKTLIEALYDAGFLRLPEDGE